MAVILLVASLLAMVATPSLGTEPWFDDLPDGEVGVHLYFFWSETCPHCQEARPVVEDLTDGRPWLLLHSLEVSDEADARVYVEMAAALGEDQLAVPAFAFCGSLTMGFDRAETTGVALANALDECHQWALDNRADLFDTVVPDPAESPPMGPGEVTGIPLIGDRDASELSLPLLTLIMASLDAFNPCAFFVLLFLLSLMVHARSRRRMLLAGGVFVLFSGLIYFAFMAAWLNLFLLTGEVRAITLVAGLIAMGLATFNLKDFFVGTGPSLSIPDSAKPRLFERMRGLVAAEKTGTMLFGTIVLALAANSYELLCTTGFPLVYTRALSLNDLSTGGFYGYLAAYNVIYVIPLLVIVILFSFTLGSRKLTAFEGRALKLVSGLMMLGLGGVLVVAPHLLDRVTTAVVLLVGTIAVSGVILKLDRRRTARR